MKLGRVSAIHFLLVVLILTTLLLCQSESLGQTPNIILLMGDDHGWEETGYNRHPHVKTPVLDDMARAGLRLDRFYSASPVCSPTRGSVITGRHPNRYGTFSANWSIRPEELSLAQLLGELGYRTGHFGKWHLGPVKEASPVNPGAMGFDRWLSHDNFFEVNPVLSENGGTPERLSGESSEVIVDAALEFISESIANHHPFLSVIWFGSPHEPYVGLPEDLSLYRNLPKLYGDREVRLTSVETGLPITRPLGEVLQERYAEITAMDRAIGKLRDFLAESGQRENTLLWYCGDNGTPASGHLDSPFRGLKGTVYEGGVRVPAIIEWPERIREPRSSEVRSVTSDILPTLLDLTGLPFPDRPLDGISLRELLEGDMQKRPAPIFLWNYDVSHELEMDREPYIEPRLLEGTTPLVKQMNGKYTRTFRNLLHSEISEADFAGARAIIQDQYKLIVDGSGAESGIELFDLKIDPGEGENLVDEKPEIVKELQEKLRAWQKSVLQSLTGADY